MARRLSLPLLIDDLETLNAQLDPYNYCVMRRNNGTLALYRILRGAVALHETAYDSYREVRSPNSVPAPLRKRLGLE